MSGGIEKPAGSDKPLPTISEDGRPFWEGCRRHEVRLQRCTDCRRYQFPARILCSHCGSRGIEWRVVAGTGRVYSYTIIHRPPEQSFAADVPYVVAVVELDEGPRMMTNLIDCSLDQVRCNMRVTPVFVDVTSTVTLIKFKPAPV